MNMYSTVYYEKVSQKEKNKKTNAWTHATQTVAPLTHFYTMNQLPHRVYSWTHLPPNLNN